MHCEGLPVSSTLYHVDLVVAHRLIPEYMTAGLQQHQVDLVWERSLRDREDYATVKSVFIEFHILVFVVVAECFV